MESRGHGGNLACEGSEGRESLKDLQRPLVWCFALGTCDIWLAGVGELPPLRREQHQGDRTPGFLQDRHAEVAIQRVLG